MQATDDQTVWTDLLPYSSLKGNQRNYFELKSSDIWTHLKLNIYPDGGVARLRAYGTVYREWTNDTAGKTVDLLAALNGGRALACSDEHYGSMWNLLLPGRGASMEQYRCAVPQSFTRIECFSRIERTKAICWTAGASGRM
jgi:allantoicase